MLRRLASSLTAIGLIALGSAISQDYAQRSVPIRAGVLILNSAQVSGTSTEAANFTPFVWYNLDSSSSVKPAGWNFYNPHAPSTYSGKVVTRWSLIQAIVGGVLPNLGANLTKQDAGYWEVNLATISDTEMADYDVLLLSAHGNTSLNPLEREKLRRFVDRGGVLWTDISNQATINAPFGTSVDLINGLPIAFSLQASNSAAASYSMQQHPLFNYPNVITRNMLNYAFHQGNFWAVNEADLDIIGLSSLTGIQQSLRLDFERLLPVFSDANGTLFGISRIGNGFMVVTSCGVASAINRSIIGGTVDVNQGPRGLGGGFDRVAQTSAKLIINMLYLTSTSPEAAQGTHRNNANALDVGAPLLKRFDAPVPLNPGTNNYVAPSVYKGLLVVCDDNRVYVYSSKPGSDLDGNGNPDDGYPDFNMGANSDLIWASEALNGPISSATCIEVPRSNIKDQILVQEQDGTVVAFNAFPRNPNGSLMGGTAMTAAYTVAPPNNQSDVDTSVEGRGPFAPTYQEGVVFVGDTENSGNGRVWVFDPSTGNKIQSGGNDWVIGNSLAPVLKSIGGPLTVGYIPIQDNSGGADRVVYAITRPDPVSPVNATAAVTSIWFGAKGEKPVSTPIIVGGNRLQIATRASQKGLRLYIPSGESRLGLKLTLLHSNGAAYSAAELDALFTGNVNQIAPGIVEFEMKNLATVDVNTTGFRLDYTVDWGSIGASNAAIRGSLGFPDDSNRSRRILHNLAMGPDGTLYAVLSNQRSGGSFFAFREEGQGAFKLLTRFDLYPEHKFTINQSEETTYGPTFLDKDPLNLEFLDFLKGQFQNLSFQGGPTYRDGQVFVTARGSKIMSPFTIDEFTVLMAFRAVPESVEINVEPIEGAFSIVQPDMLRSPDITEPATMTILGNGQYRYEVSSTEKAVIRIDNLMASNRGPMINAINTSQPIIIRRTGKEDLIIEPGKSGSKWSPLLYYMVVTGLKNSSPAFITGDSLFVAGTSRVPNLVSGLPVFAPARGLLYSITANISPNDAFLVSDSDRPWMHQLYQMKRYGVGGDVEPNPDILWPQSKGVMSFDNYRTRVLQTVLGDTLTASTSGFGVVGGDGGIFSWTSDGVWAFDRADFLVCDEGRVARFDGSGNPIWSTDTTYAGGYSLDTTNSTTAHPLVRPTRAYSLGVNDTIIVDPGANRVVRIDNSGREIRSLDQFYINDSHIPEGYQTGETLNLREPRDVLVFNSFEAPANNPFSNATGDEYWIHYVIADTGNDRLLEIVDRYSADIASGQVGNLIEHGSLYWHSPASFSGKGFGYNSLMRTWIDDGANSRFVYACGIGKTLPTRINTGLDVPDATGAREDRSGNGGIVIFDGNNSQVINSVTIPGSVANTVLDINTGTFNSPATSAKKHAISNLQSVTMRMISFDGDGDGTPEGHLGIMFTDSSGVYEIVQNGSDWQVVWMMDKAMYLAMRRDTANNLSLKTPLGFRPTFARRLTSGEVLIVNGFIGRTRDQEEFYGDIIQVVGGIENGVLGSGFSFTRPNGGFDQTSIRFELPPVQGTRGIILPVFADRR